MTTTILAWGQPNDLEWIALGAVVLLVWLVVHFVRSAKRK